MVLLIDDNPLVLEALTALLETNGHEVLESLGGRTISFLPVGWSNQ